MASPSKQLTVQERADQALTIEHTEKELVELAGKTADITEIKDNADYELVKRGALVLRDVRVQIERAGKTARDDANLFSKAVIAKQKDLVGLIAPEETRLKAMRTEIDEAAERRAEELRQAEVNRITDIERRIKAIHKLSEGLLNADAEAIRARIEAVECLLTTNEYFGEFSDQATQAREKVAEALAVALVARVDLEAQKAEQERVAAEQAHKQVELDKQAETNRLFHESLEKEKRNAEEKVRREEADRQEKIRQEAERKAAEDKAERERLEELEAARARAEAIEKENERQKELLPAKEKLQAWAEEIRHMEGPKGIRGKNQQKIVNDALRGLGEVGNQIHASVERL